MSDDFLPGFDDEKSEAAPPPLPEASPSPSYETKFNLHHGDCVEGMKELPKDSVDIVVTSPPYNLGIKYASYQDNLSSDEYIAWTREWTGEVKRVLKLNGSFFLNIGSMPANPWTPFEVALALRDEFSLQNTIHWIKSITVEPKDSEPVSAGHFKPINSKRFINDCHEFVFHFTKTGMVELDRKAVGVPYVHKSNINRWGHTEGQDKRCRGNTWFVPYPTIKSRKDQRPHPATFPVELARKCIQLHGREPKNMTMLEPFLGIGHAATAAGDCGVGKFIGFEIDEVYLAEAKERIGLGEKE